MSKLADVTSEDRLKKLATPSNYTLGKELVHHTEIIDQNEKIVTAKVRGGDTRTVTLQSDGNILDYSCTCLGQKHFFCKHCVATALAIRSV